MKSSSVPVGGNRYNLHCLLAVSSFFAHQRQSITVRYNLYALWGQEILRRIGRYICCLPQRPSMSDVWNTYNMRGCRAASTYRFIGWPTGGTITTTPPRLSDSDIIGCPTYSASKESVVSVRSFSWWNNGFHTLLWPFSVGAGTRLETFEGCSQTWLFNFWTIYFRFISFLSNFE